MDPRFKLKNVSSSPLFGYAEDGADGVMVEAVNDLDFVSEVVDKTSVPVMVNQLHGGKSPYWTLQEMQDVGVSIVIYSTPCLFAAQYGMEKYLDQMMETGVLPDENTSEMHDCVNLLYSPPNYHANLRSVNLQENNKHKNK